MGAHHTDTHKDEISDEGVPYTGCVYIMRGRAEVTQHYKSREEGSRGQILTKTRVMEGGQGFLIHANQRHSVKSITRCCVKLRVSLIRCTHIRQLVPVDTYATDGKRSLRFNKKLGCYCGGQATASRKRKHPLTVETSKHHYTPRERAQRKRKYDRRVNNPGAPIQVSQVK